MPITTEITGEGKDRTLSIRVTNGELNAIQKAESKWNFKDTASFLEFVIAVFISDGLEIYLEKDGEKTKIAPADKLLREKTDSGS
jgi:hypothetical protein